jgi:hypothetical protein
MRYTDVDFYDPDHPHRTRDTRDTLQIVSVKVKALTGGLQWPLDVYGFVAVRDFSDRKRNMLFNRERMDSQIISEQVCENCN